MSYITKFYQQRKQRIVYAMGGQCALCGYKKNIQALEMQKQLFNILFVLMEKNFQ